MILPALITLVLVPLMARLALKMGIVDRPDGVLKPHGRVVPYLGGLAMFFGSLPVLWKDSTVLLASSMAVSVGLIDDMISISPKLRLLVEFSLASLIAFRFTGTSDPLMLSVMIVAIVALINAVNMTDGMDGMAAGAVAISSAFLLTAVENPLARDLSLTVLSVSLAFLVYNFPPAKVFMGDAGSYLLGTILSAILASSMRYGWSPMSLRYVFPVWIYALDLLSGFVRRIRAGKSPFEGDRDHFYDKIKRRTGSDLKTLMISYALVAIFSAAILIKPFFLAVSYELLISALTIWKLNLLDYDG